MGKVVEKAHFSCFLLLFVMCCSKSKIFITFFGMLLNIKNLFPGNTLLKTNIFVLCHLFPSWLLQHTRCTGNCKENFPTAQITLPFSRTFLFQIRKYCDLDWFSHQMSDSSTIQRHTWLTRPSFLRVHDK